MPHKKEKILLVVLLLLLFIINYSFLDKALIEFLDDSERVVVERVIDGDTIVSNGSIRLLGINCPEKGEEFYEESKKFLENMILNESIILEFGKDKTDRYNRRLAYVFYRGENLNLQLVREGFANYYFPSGKDSYYKEFVKVWEECLDSNKRLCEKSKDRCVNCIEIKNFGYNKDLILYNVCNFDCELDKWSIKDEGRKNFIFKNFTLKGKNSVKIIVGEGEDTDNELYWKEENYVWTKSGDSLFLRDGKNRLVLFDSY